MSSLRRLGRAFRRWREHRDERTAAALAFYSVFSIAPLVMLGVALSSMAAGEAESKRFLLDFGGAFLGERGVEALGPMVRNAGRLGAGAATTLIGLATALAGSSRVFVELQDALNQIWGLPPARRGRILSYMKRRAASFAFVLLVALILLAGPFVSARLAELGRGQGLQFAGMLAFETLLFAAIFRTLPERKIPWRDLWTGSALTAALFTAGQFLLGLYLGKVGARSVYGAAGSLVALLFWVYVSAQILLFGAEFIGVEREAEARPRLRQGGIPTAP